MGVARVRIIAWHVLATLALSVLPPGIAVAEPGPRIVGGSRASIVDYPWTVYLRTASGFQYCGGTLVAPSSVLTAAHCTASSGPAEIFVVAGREDTSSEDGVVAAVTRIWIHPEFDRPTYRNDVSVLTLDRSLPYRTLPLATPADAGLYAPGTPADVFGWGITEGGSPSRYLMRASVPVGTDGYCSQGYPEQFDPALMVCAGYPEGGIDACQGDSGGPLVVEGRLIGFTSFGTGCAEPGHPGVYARVSTYSDTIAAQIPP